MEINARNLGSGTVIANKSGLRFRQLTSTSPTVANPGSGILALSLDGDVIYVPAPLGGLGTVTGAHNGTSMSTITPNFVAFGQNVGGGTVGQLLSDREVPMNNNNITFTDPAVFTAGENRIGIGTNPVAAKLQVQNAEAFLGGYIESNVSSNPSLGANGFGARAIGSNAVNVSIEGLSLGAGSSTSVGVTGQSIGNNGSTNIGGDFTGQTVPGQTGFVNYGIISRAYGLSSFANYAVFAEVNGGTPGTGGPNNFGIFSRAPIEPNSWAGFFNGKIQVQGDIEYSGALIFVSDQTFKTQIDTIVNAENIIDQLKPRTFYFDTTVTSMNFPSRKQYGFIAQDVETILPELVSAGIKPEERDSLGNIISPSLTYKTLNYNAFIAILMKGMQEQNKKIDSLSQKLSEVITTVNSCCNSNHSMQQNNNANNSISSQDVNLKDEQSIVLETNVPNPFAEQTTINYFLPDNVVKAQMLFYNVQGKLIQSVELTEKGKGSLNVFAQDLSNGIYTYTLVVDGKVFETKKMVKQK